MWITSPNLPQGLVVDWKWDARILGGKRRFRWRINNNNDSFKSLIQGLNFPTFFSSSNDMKLLQISQQNCFYCFSKTPATTSEKHHNSRRTLLTLLFSFNGFLGFHHRFSCPRSAMNGDCGKSEKAKNKTFINNSWCEIVETNARRVGETICKNIDFDSGR